MISSSVWPLFRYTSMVASASIRCFCSLQVLQFLGQLAIAVLKFGHGRFNFCNLGIPSNFPSIMHRHPIRNNYKTFFYDVGVKKPPVLLLNTVLRVVKIGQFFKVVIVLCIQIQRIWKVPCNYYGYSHF